MSSAEIPGRSHTDFPSSMVVFDTVFPADSLEFCPTIGYQDIFVCGTYNLLEQPPSQSKFEEVGSSVAQKRRGQCLVFRTNPCEDYLPRHIQSFDLPAILDMKWSYASKLGIPLLGIADSEGSVTLHEWREESLFQIDSVRCAPMDTLCLSLDWSNRRLGGTDGSLVVSLSNGSICLLRPTDGKGLSVIDIWHAHDYEPWVAAWDYWSSDLIYSGGDDLKLKAWDIRQGFTQPTFVNKRFDAGVTSIQSHPHVQHLLAVGSYDSTVRIFDVRQLGSSLAQTEVGGGAWRVKWHPDETRKEDLLVACMHDGFKVVRFGPDGRGFSGESEIVKRHDDHESMAYGVDWSHAPPLASGETLIGGCSFYDHKMSLWSA